MFLHCTFTRGDVHSCFSRLAFRSTGYFLSISGISGNLFFEFPGGVASKALRGVSVIKGRVPRTDMKRKRGREEGVRSLPRPAPPAPPAPPTTATTSIRFWRKRPVRDEAWVRRLALHDDKQNKTAIKWQWI